MVAGKCIRLPKMETRREDYLAEREADKKIFANVLCYEDERLKVFHVARWCARKNHDVIEIKVSTWTMANLRLMRLQREGLGDISVKGC